MRKKRLKPTRTEETLEPVEFPEKRCLNPWNGECRNTDIALFIYYGGRKLPICRSCWLEIASTNIEWSYN